jgi:hypothetical protein
MILRKEAAVALGALGSAIVLALQVILGQADISEIGPAVTVAVSTSLPFLLGLATRGLVWAKANVDRLLGSAPDLAEALIRTYGGPAAVDALRRALAAAERSPHGYDPTP